MNKRGIPFRGGMCYNKKGRKSGNFPAAKPAGKELTGMKSKMLLIDGNSILNRAFYGIRPLTTKDGLYTHAVYGMINILSKHILALSPEYAACAFDRKAPTFRHLKYPAYKATRHGMPQELAVQLPYAKEAVAALGLPIIEMDGYEADDILGTSAQFSAADPELVTYILTGDRDSLQLIRDNVYVLLASTGETAEMNRQAFAEKYGGTSPEQFVDVKALMGDSSDNIPGVAGIGEKTALKFIAEYGSLDGLYAALSDGKFTPSVLKKLREGKESAYLSRELARILTTVPLNMTLENYRYGGIQRQELKRLLTKLELHTLLKRFGLTGEGTGQTGEAERKTADIEKPTGTLSEESGKRPASAHNFSTSESTEPPELSTMSTEFSTESSEKCAKPGLAPAERQLAPEALKDIWHDRVPAMAEEAGRLVLSDGMELAVCVTDSFSRLRPLLEDADRTLCVYDSKALISRAAQAGIRVQAKLFDVQLAAYVLAPTDSSYALSRLCVAYLGCVPEEGICEAVLLARLYPVLKQKLEETGQLALYRDIELPLARVLSAMERRGFQIDREALTAFGKELDGMCAAKQAEVYRTAGEEFNLNSPKQLGKILFEKLGLPALRKTRTGYSTDAETLEKLLPYHPVIGQILEYRQVAKLKSTYADGLLREADENGRIHTVFNQTVTATGRLSSSEPNLQNIPVRTELGRELRRFFVPRASGRVLVDADYSQIELRLLAAVSCDENMIEAFRSGEDIHTITASQVFHVPPEEVTPELRKRAKAVNFGIVYGIGDYSLSQDLGVSRKEAAEYIRRYFEQYPAVRLFLQNAVEQAKETGRSQTIFGRRRQIPELSSAKKTVRAFGERVAMNSPIQGAAADIIKLAMIRTEKALREAGIDAQLILQVHDELILDADKGCAAQAAALLKEAMEHAVTLPVPLTVSVGIGENWLECK